MTNYNDEDKSFDIPDFVEDKDDNDTSDDMSIFKMSEKELYDDVPKKEEKRKAGKHKANSTIILCFVVIAFLIVVAVVGIMYAIQKNNDYIAANDKVVQLESANKELNDEKTTLENEVAELEAKIKELEEGDTKTDADGKYKSGTTLYITSAGHEYAIREKADMDSAKGETQYWGHTITLTGDAVIDEDGNYWGKVDGGYFPIEYNGVIFASTEKQ